MQTGNLRSRKNYRPNERNNPHLGCKSLAIAKEIMNKLEQSLRELVVMSEYKLNCKFTSEGIVCKFCSLKRWAYYTRMN